MQGGAAVIGLGPRSRSIEKSGDWKIIRIGESRIILSMYCILGFNLNRG